MDMINEWFNIVSYAISVVRWEYVAIYYIQVHTCTVKMLCLLVIKVNQDWCWSCTFSYVPWWSPTHIDLGMKMKLILMNLNLLSIESGGSPMQFLFAKEFVNKWLIWTELSWLCVTNKFVTLMCDWLK